jgi:hypothetical protein
VRAPAADQTSIHVDAVALDDLLLRLELDPDEIGLLWIDAEEHEAEVLRGASALLQAGVPIIVEVRRESAPLLPIVGNYKQMVDLRASNVMASIDALDQLAAKMQHMKDPRTTTDILLLR